MPSGGGSIRRRRTHVFRTWLPPVLLCVNKEQDHRGVTQLVSPNKINSFFSTVEPSGRHFDAPQTSKMAQRKKKLTKKKKHAAHREPEAESDSGDFELAAEVKDDDSVSVFYSKPCWLIGKELAR